MLRLNFVGLLLQNLPIFFFFNFIKVFNPFKLGLKYKITASEKINEKHKKVKKTSNETKIVNNLLNFPSIFNHLRSKIDAQKGYWSTIILYSCNIELFYSIFYEIKKLIFHLLLPVPQVFSFETIVSLLVICLSVLCRI